MSEIKKAVLSVLTILLLLLFSDAAICFASASPEPTSKTIPKELKIGKKASEQVEKQIPRVLDPALEAKLAMIANKLIPHMERNLEYKVRILEMKEPNAFSLPGGRTYITTGMLDFLKSDAEIAAILAHEFVHADRAHGIVQAARNNRLNLITLAGIIAATQGGGMAAAMLASTLQTALMNSYSIDLEKEADARGIDVLYKAGYNPAAMLTTMERLKVERLKRVYVNPGIYQTHPDDDERIEADIKYMKDNGIEIQRKNVVQKLKTNVADDSGMIRMTIDGAEFLSAPENEDSQRFFRELKKRIDDTLELELAPYDVMVQKEKNNESLRIKGKIILNDKDLLPGMPGLAEIRNRLIKALSDARNGNPLTDYYQ